jgi:hypothetical protein
MDVGVAIFEVISAGFRVRVEGSAREERRFRSFGRGV